MYTPPHFAEVREIEREIARKKEAEERKNEFIKKKNAFEIKKNCY